MKKTIKSLEEEFKRLRRKYRELRESYSNFYWDAAHPNKKELWFYSTPMTDTVTRELFLSVHSAEVLGYECVLTAEGACTTDKKLHVTFVAKRPSVRPAALAYSEVL